MLLHPPDTVMKLLLSLLVALMVTTLSSAQLIDDAELCQCPTPVNVSYGGCGGFTKHNTDFWINQTFWNGTECIADIVCCSANPSEECCMEWPAGWYVAFAIGVGGIGVMILICLFNCFCAKKKEVPGELD